MWRLYILVAVLLLLLIYLLSKRYIEGFGNSIYLSKNETATFLIRDEDEYVSSMTMADLHARKVKTHAEYREKLGPTSIEFTETEKVLVDECIDKANLFFKNLKSPYIDNKLMDKIYWKFALTNHRDYEEGFPHTRQDVIFITPSLLEMSKETIITTIIHEKIHVYQRMYPELFRAALKTAGYVQLRERKTEPLVRANPDIDEFIYLSPTGQEMISLYNSDKPTSISDIKYSKISEHPYEEIAYAIAAEYTTKK
jgi:hypothetical protein